MIAVGFYNDGLFKLLGSRPLYQSPLQTLKFFGGHHEHLCRTMEISTSVQFVFIVCMPNIHF